MEIISLLSAEVDMILTIRDIKGAYSERMQTMGLFIGSDIQVLRSNSIVTVLRGSNRIALDRSLAHDIYCEVTSG